MVRRFISRAYRVLFRPFFLGVVRLPAYFVRPGFAIAVQRPYWALVLFSFIVF